MQTIYLAAPLFSDAERLFNKQLAQAIRTALSDCTLLVPQEFCAVHDAAHGDAGDPSEGNEGNDSNENNAATPDFGAIFADCVAHLDQSQLVIAVLDGPDPDSGTCWEVGYAYARQVPVIGLRTDWRPGEDSGVNCMLTRSCTAVCRTGADVIAAIQATTAPT